MKNKVRHLLGISGGKDSAALAIYFHTRYPELGIEYYFCDTGKELKETYQLINELEGYLGKRIKRLEAANESHKSPFDHFLSKYDGYLPAPNARWCTKILKLEPFEEFVGNDPAISYVAIRGDEDREGYISTKPNIQTVFPFRKNIWSLEIVSKVLDNINIGHVANIYKNLNDSQRLNRILGIVMEPTSIKFSFSKKLSALLELGIREFNHVVYEILKDTSYPLSWCPEYPLLDNEEVLVKSDIFRLFEENGVTIPKYYDEIEFYVNGQRGKYHRSRSGCYFCFYQQKIEWVWLYEQHADLYKKAMQYEKDGYTWMQGESLSELIKPDRIQKIKEDYLRKTNINSYKSTKLVDILEEDSGMSCVNCFI